MPPHLLLSIMLGAVYGTLFFLWRGQGLKDLVIYLIAAALGLIAGQAVGNLLGFTLFQIGPIHPLEATAGSWLFLMTARWLKI
jgi:hypothetical protein